jgi:hypothetical protein
VTTTIEDVASLVTTTLVAAKLERLNQEKRSRESPHFSPAFGTVSARHG